MYEREAKLVRRGFRSLEDPKTFQESEARGRRSQTKLPEETKSAEPFECIPRAQARIFSKRVHPGRGTQSSAGIGLTPAQLMVGASETLSAQCPCKLSHPCCGWSFVQRAGCPFGKGLHIPVRLRSSSDFFLLVLESSSCIRGKFLPFRAL